MKKVMLIYPPGRLFQRGEDRCQANIKASTATSMRACNDLGYAAAVLLKKGCDVFLRDYQTEKAAPEDLYADVCAYSPDMLVMSTTNATVYDDIAVADELKRISGAVIVLKGAIFFNPPDGFDKKLPLRNVDYLIGGEIDAAVASLAECVLFGEKDICDAAFVLYKKNGRFIKGNFCNYNSDLDSVPFPARQLMNNSLYVRPDCGRPMATIETSRGCSCGCTYCLSPVLSGRMVRKRSPQNVYAELCECYEKYEISDFFFKSDTFTIDAEWVQSLCELIIASPLYGKIEFTANSRVNPIEKRTVDIMKKAGCFAIAFGFESGSDDTLKKINKGATTEQARRARLFAKQAGIPVFGFFMIGFPWENMADLKRTEAFIFELKPDFLELSVALAYYGTPLYTQCNGDGLINSEIFGNDYFESVCAGTKYLSAKDLYSFRNRVLLKYHVRPQYILAKITEAWREPVKLKNYFGYGFRMLKNIFTTATRVL